MTTTSMPVAQAPSRGFDRHEKVTLAVASLATLATFLDTTILYVAFPDISATFSDAHRRRAVVGAQRLHDRVRRAAHPGRQARRPDRAPQGRSSPARRCSRSPRWPAAWRRRAELLIVFRIVQAVGAAALIPSSLALVMHAFAHDQAAARRRHLGRGRRRRRRPRTHAGRGDRRGARVAVGVLHQPARRHLHRVAGAQAPARVVRPRDPGARPSSASSSSPPPPAPVLRPGRHRRLRMAQRRAPSACSAPGSSCSPSSSSTSGAPRPRRSTSSCSASPTSAGRNLAMLVFGTAFAALFFGSILFLTDVWGWSVLQAGFGVAPGPVVVGLLAPRAGKLAGRIGQRPILIAGGVLFAGGGLLRLVILGPEVDYLRDFFPSMVLSGLGVASVFPQLSSVVAQALPPAAPASAAPPPKRSASSAARSASRSPSPSSPHRPASTAHSPRSNASGGSSWSAVSASPCWRCRSVRAVGPPPQTDCIP